MLCSDAIAVTVHIYIYSAKGRWRIATFLLQVVKQKSFCGEKRMKAKKGLTRLALDFADKMSMKNIGAFASSTAFFFFLSLIPILVLLSSLIPYTNVREIDLVNAIVRFVPGVAKDMLTKIIDESYRKSSGLLSLSAVVTIWSAAKGMLALIRGMNAVYEVQERRNYFYLRFIASLYTIALMLLVVLMLVLFVFGEILRRFLEASFPRLHFLTALLLHSRILIVMVLAVFLFTLIYTYIPSVKQKFIYQIPGALFSAIAWGIFSLFFSLFVNHVGSYSAYYGSLAALVITMFWLYCCIYILMIGGHINCYFHPAVKVLYSEYHHNRIRKKLDRKIGRER